MEKTQNIVAYENKESDCKTRRNEKDVPNTMEVSALEKTLRIYWDKFNLGQQDLHVLLQEQRAYNKAQQNRIQSMGVKTYGYFKLLANMGELIPYLNDNINN